MVSYLLSLVAVAFGKGYLSMKEKPVEVKRFLGKVTRYGDRHEILSPVPGDWYFFLPRDYSLHPISSPHAAAGAPSLQSNG